LLDESSSICPSLGEEMNALLGSHGEKPRRVFLCRQRWNLLSRTAEDQARGWTFIFRAKSLADGTNGNLVVHAGVQSYPIENTSDLCLD